jgi:hypothetical protein
MLRAGRLCRSPSVAPGSGVDEGGHPARSTFGRAVGASVERVGGSDSYASTRPGAPRPGLALDRTPDVVK